MTPETEKIAFDSSKESVDYRSRVIMTPLSVSLVAGEFDDNFFCSRVFARFGALHMHSLVTDSRAS